MSDEIKQQIFALMAHAEEQQEALDKAIENMVKTTTSQARQLEMHLDTSRAAMPLISRKIFSDAIEGSKDAIADDLSKNSRIVLAELKKATEDALNASESVKENTRQLGWKYAVMTTGAVFLACLAMILMSFLIIPSMDEIHQRKHTIAELNKRGGKAQVAVCEGETCIRIMKKKCGYGKNGDYCIIDPE